MTRLTSITASRLLMFFLGTTILMRSAGAVACTCTWVNNPGFCCLAWRSAYASFFLFSNLPTTYNASGGDQSPTFSDKYKTKTFRACFMQDQEFPTSPVDADNHLLYACDDKVCACPCELCVCICMYPWEIATCTLEHRKRARDYPFTATITLSVGLCRG
jgi:hypothetical protein